MLKLSKKILVAIDGSPLSDKAAEEAVRMASGNQSQFKSKVFGLLVLPGAPKTTFTDFVPARPITEQAKWSQLKERIFFVLEKIAAEEDVPLETTVVYGNPADGGRRDCDRQHRERVFKAKAPRERLPQGGEGRQMLGLRGQGVVLAVSARR